MFFDSLRKRFKWLIVVIAAAFGIGLLYVGVPFFGGGTTSAAVVAKVNGSNVSYQEHQAAFQNLVYQYQMYMGGLSATDQEYLQYQALEMILNTKLVLEAARKEGIKVAKDEIDAELEETKSIFESESQYRAALQQSGMTEKELRALIEEDLLLQKVMEKRQAEVEITDEEIAQAYEAVNARHILIRPEVNDAGELDWDAALDKATQLLEELKNGADFAALAAEHSADGSAEVGGELGYFARGMMVPEFEEAAFSLAAGEISEPVRTQYGYHIIQVTEWRKPEGEEFEAQKESIRTSLQQQRGQEAINAWIESLRTGAKVEILDPLLNAVSHVVNGQYAQAISFYEEAMELSPNNGYINHSLGNVYQLLGDAERSLEQFETAVSKQPYDPELHYSLALAYLAQEKNDEAAKALVKVAELSPNDYMTLSQIQSTLQNLGFSDEAETVQGYLDDLLQRYQEQIEAQQEAEGDTTEATNDTDTTDETTDTTTQTE